MDFVIALHQLKYWYRKGYIVPLVLPVKLDQSLWHAAQRIVRENRHAFFLDSVRFQEKTAQYSYLGWKPFQIYQQKNYAKVLPELRKIFKSYSGRRWEKLPFFTGGAVGYFSYDFGRTFETLPDRAKDDLKLAPASLLFVRDLLVFDHQNNRCFLIANLIPEKDGSFDRAFQTAKQSIEMMGKTVGAYCNTPLRTNGSIRVSNFQPDIPKRQFKHIVHRAKQYIEAGDIYQVNLSQRFSFRLKGDQTMLYRSLREINPSPFSSFLKIGPLSVLSVSPERLIRRDGDFCQTRPIAGTRPRGRNQREDERFFRDLINSPKERAEHLMLVDLERNDLGRVCKPHSVRVSEFMTLERYSHVVHIVSNVVGTLKKNHDQFDLLTAMFPGGTITGCPKIRSMEIIEELEPFKRNLYTGSIGWIDFNGDMDLNIVIRSIVLRRGKGHLQVGAGIVYDSDPEQEYWETLHKGKALVDALARYA